MEPFEYIAFLSVFIWLLVPLVNYKSAHFYFFLFLGLNDLIAITLWFVFGISSQSFLIPAIFLIVFSIEREFFLKKWKEIFVGLVVTLVLNDFMPIFSQYIIRLVAYIIIFVVFSKHLYWNYINFNKISFFYSIMTLYSLFSVVKSVLLLGNIKFVNEYFVGTTIQIIIGIILIFIKKDIQFSTKD